MTSFEAKDSAGPPDLASYFRREGERALLTTCDERWLAAAVARLEGGARPRPIEPELGPTGLIRRGRRPRGLPPNDSVAERGLGGLLAALVLGPGRSDIPLIGGA